MLQRGTLQNCLGFTAQGNQDIRKVYRRAIPHASGAQRHSLSYGEVFWGMAGERVGLVKEWLY